jgi:hypothetical protein
VCVCVCVCVCVSLSVIRCDNDWVGEIRIKKKEKKKLQTLSSLPSVKFGGEVQTLQRNILLSSLGRR